jgi:hypothetical protein
VPYVLYRFVLGSSSRIRISKSEYEYIKNARSGLLEIVGAEEKFDSVMENFVELEQALLVLSLRHLTFLESDYKAYQAPRNTISRRILNLLSSSRLYRDALLQHTKRIVGAKDARKIKDALRDGPQQPMNFRMVEALRNYSQHQELPIIGITFQSRREEEENKPSKVSYSVEPLINAAEVGRRRDLAADVKAALRALGASVNPMSMIREHVEHIGAIHRQFRELVEGEETRWETIIAGGMARFRKRYPNESRFGLAAGIVRPNGAVTEPIFLVKEASTGGS